ncbi:hypothetical protein BJY52DRAFT_94949 [Lactarius psammicola]|nr:hypothetical protein BJY52DRAFT_94949 [Lactarius psammicola]
MAHYDTFRDQLAIAHPAFGYALWEPDPGEQSSPVEVGDVGYIRQGKFYRIFNALLPANHPSHESLGVPEDHEQLRPRMQDHINRGTLSPNTFYSYGVTVVSGGLEVHSAETTGSVQDSFSFTRKYGAVLALPVTARREDTLVLGHFRKWIINHIDSWFAFTQKLRLGIEMEDIILVTGCHRTTTWTNIAFNEVHTEAQVSSGLQIPGGFGSPANWPVSSQHSQGTARRHGPSGENLPENQCIFVRGYRVARTSNILSRVRRAVGTIADPSRSDSEPETEVVPMPTVTEVRLPLLTS